MIISHPNDTKKRLAIYSVIAGALTAGTAHAGIQQAPGFPVSLTDDTDGSSSASMMIDIDGNGETDFELSIYYETDCSTATHGASHLYGFAYGGQVATDESSYYAGMISAGTQVDSALNWQGYGYFTGCYEAGNFEPNSRGFVAVSFMRDGAQHYGFLDVETIGTDSSLTVTIHRSFYENAPRVGLAAAAFDSTPIPVGGAVPLSLGVLALGAAALRRRRNQQ